MSDFIRKEAQIQADAGADYIDVNTGTFMESELDHLKWVVDIVQEAVNVPLCIDSPDPGVIQKILPMVQKTPMINSITLEPARLEGILPLAAQRGAKVIALCQSSEGMAQTVEEKVQMAHDLVDKARQAGLDEKSLYVDPLVYPVATNPDSAVATLSAIQRIAREIPETNTICGLTNVSYALPERKLVNRTFLVAAISRGLSAAILDPTDKALFGALKASLALMGEDEFCLDFIEAYREGKIS